MEEEKTTATGIDRHIPVWSLVEQDRATEGMRALCRKREAGSRPGRLDAGPVELIGHIGGGGGGVYYQR